MNEHDVPRRVEELIRSAEEAGASDVHLHIDGGRGDVAFRVDGVLVPIRALEQAIAERVIGRIKFLARLKTYQHSLPQDGRINRKDVNARHDIRVATYPTVGGEKIVLRLFGDSSVQPLHALGIGDEIVESLKQFLRQNTGLLLLTGPAGSGKTTTIYACLRHLVEIGGRHIITIEDPVEQVVPGVMQTEINEARGLTFAKAARHLLRQDPQVLVIGEIRDEETANIAVRAALTGHLVIATLHAGSCRGVFERLLDLCTERYSAVAAVGLVLNQRLLRRLCRACAGQGCDACFGTGYRGRVPAVEWLAPDESMRRMVLEHGPGMLHPAKRLSAAAGELVAAQLTDERELERVL